MIDVINKKQMPDSVITGKEYASKDWTCLISMFLSSFDVYFVCGCACFMFICLKTAIWLFWDKVWHFWWRQVGNPIASFSKIRSCKPGCAQASQGAHLCSTVRVRRDISAASFCSCKLLWRSDECFKNFLRMPLTGNHAAIKIGFYLNFRLLKWNFAWCCQSRDMAQPVTGTHDTPKRKTFWFYTLCLTLNCWILDTKWQIDARIFSLGAWALEGFFPGGQ